MNDDYAYFSHVSWEYISKLNALIGGDIYLFINSDEADPEGDNYFYIREIIIDKWNDLNTNYSWFCDSDFNLDQYLLNLKELKEAIFKLCWIINTGVDHGGCYNFDFDDYNAEEFAAGGYM